MASTDDLARAVDQAQHETGEGPCLDALHERRTARIPEMATEERWPASAARGLELGIGSMLAVQVFVLGANLGALNISSEEVRALDEESEHVALLFASHAAIAMIGPREQAQLRVGDRVPRPDQPGEGHPDGEVQGDRRAGLPRPRSGQPEQQPQAARRRHRAGGAGQPASVT